MPQVITKELDLLQLHKYSLPRKVLYMSSFIQYAGIKSEHSKHVFF